MYSSIPPWNLSVWFSLMPNPTIARSCWWRQRYLPVSKSSNEELVSAGVNWKGKKFCCIKPCSRNRIFYRLQYKNGFLFVRFPHRGGPHSVNFDVVRGGPLLINLPYNCDTSLKVESAIFHYARSSKKNPRFVLRTWASLTLHWWAWRNAK